MRLWAEERKSGTIELLMTLPVTRSEAVLGKFLAAWLFIGIALVLTFPIWITVNYLGSPDNGAILAGYLGSLLMAGGFLAIGACISAPPATRWSPSSSPSSAASASCWPASRWCSTSSTAWAPAPLVDAIASLSFLTHFDALSSGVIELRDVVYFLLVIGAWLTANAIVLDMKKAD
jgi:ABC-2 type transport system permease protein